MARIPALALLLCLSLTAFSQIKISTPTTNKMEVAVWDTYVKKKDGTVMHFDILAPSSQRDTTVIHNYGREYLRTKGQEGQALTAKECRFCHVESMRPKWAEQIQKQGYFIIEMEGCE